MDDLTVVIPAYKEDPVALTKTWAELISLGCHVIIVDDGNSMDLPYEIDSITYAAQVGYGYAIKYGIDHTKTPFVLTMDADGQHTVEDVKKLYQVFKLIDDCKMLVGCRWNLKETPHRWFGRKFLNFIASLIAGHYLIDLNSGMRMFDTKLARSYKPILCDTFSFTTSLTMSMVTDNHKIAWFPINVKARNQGRSHVKVIRDGLVTLYYIVWVGLALRTRRIRTWLRNILGRSM